jgi:hypothetical protein
VLARRACQIAGVRTCSVYLRDPGDRTFRGRAIHNPVRRDALEWLRHSEAGIHADGFTRQILETRAPVLIKNAQRDPRPVRTAMREWGIDEMLGVPMVVDEEVVGLLFLDNRGEPHTYSKREQISLLALANLGALAVRHAERADRDGAAFRELVRDTRMLRQATAVQSALTQRVLEGGGVDDVARAVATMTGKPCAVLNDELEQLAAAMAPGGEAAWSLGAHGMRSGHCARAASGLMAGGHTVVEPEPAAGVHRRLLMVRGPEHARGCLVVLAEHGSRLSGFDVIVAERAAALIALQCTVARPREWAAAGDGGARGRDNRVPDSLERLARVHGIDAAEFSAVALLRGDALPPAADFERALANGGASGSVLCVAREKGVVALFALDAPDGRAVAAKAKRVVDRAVRALPDLGELRAAVAACAAEGDYTGAARECEALLAAKANPGHARLPVEDERVVDRHAVSAVSQLLAYCDPQGLERFARETLGKLLDGTRESRTMLATLNAFMETGRSVRRVARTLDVHENTVRYRLRRIAEITGLDVVGDPEDGFAAQAALRALGGPAGISPRCRDGRDADEGRGAYEPMPTA